MGSNYAKGSSLIIFMRIAHLSLVQTINSQAVSAPMLEWHGTGPLNRVDTITFGSLPIVESISTCWLLQPMFPFHLSYIWLQVRKSLLSCCSIDSDRRTLMELLHSGFLRVWLLFTHIALWRNLRSTPHLPASFSSYTASVPRRSRDTRPCNQEFPYVLHFSLSGSRPVVHQDLLHDTLFAFDGYTRLHSVICCVFPPDGASYDEGLIVSDPLGNCSLRCKCHRILFTR